MKKWIYSIFLTYLILGIYVLTIAIKTPFISLILDTTNGQAVIMDSYYPSWAQKKNIEKGISSFPLMGNQPGTIALCNYFHLLEVPIS